MHMGVNLDVALSYLDANDSPHTRGGANLNKTPSALQQRVFCLYAHESAGYLQVLLPFQVNSIMAQDPVHKVLPGQ